LVTASYTPYFKEFGITYPQYLVLMLLWEQDNRIISEITERLNLETNTVTPLLQRMEKQGLIVRQKSQADSRQRIISLTGEGKRLEEKMKNVPNCLAQKIVDLYYSNPSRKKGKPVSVSISVSTFVPKPFTPFEFEQQISLEEINRKQQYLLSCVSSKKISVSWHQSYTSMLEGVFARGDRKLCDVLLLAHKRGLKFDGWDECFDFNQWLKVFEDCNITTEFYANRLRPFEEILPWDHLDYAVNKDFLVKQNQLAHKEITTKNCREGCSSCGASCYGEGVCFEKR
jgi:DNA-binding MarR family transcriptional regulator